MKATIITLIALLVLSPNLVAYDEEVYNIVYKSQLEKGNSQTYSKGYAFAIAEGQNKQYATIYAAYAEQLEAGKSHNYAVAYATVIANGKSKQYATTYATTFAEQKEAGKSGSYALAYSAAIASGKSKRQAHRAGLKSDK